MRAREEEALAAAASDFPPPPPNLPPPPYNNNNDHKSIPDSPLSARNGIMVGEEDNESEGSQSEYNGIFVYNEHPFITKAKAVRVRLMESLCLTNFTL